MPHYRTRSVRRTGGFVLTGKPDTRFRVRPICPGSDYPTECSMRTRITQCVLNYRYSLGFARNNAGSALLKSVWCLESKNSVLEACSSPTSCLTSVMCCV